ncbi:DUF2867 domain-containing protein [Undibacterium sp. RTI2.1]|uniref:DUF2867 domain-containing protein n=1 Tax=unclassified Undibacterium TaxID=2630295 RepID=UPI002AB3B646|nr:MULTISPECIES: DUF2867 domain-containing protein [unclassified Undibacterium]MDY7539776.1 DUF2867 domain-containing protein [Undibacterium sp. 5I1]MEB0029438.1 DUF2867 domain-containing protein [Undibacterium sp. RTI2.1]MEB0115943.1 DUF2867 domain-containing protein [Undibacterium sp. RTI2.2]MEB0232441.1 DUF2867 domain-containing protein [Undibacterium sp. 10I3]MEB0256811.1 DUF2867 domain-containing protein [Undibacterium sp. 5I1]
MQCAYQQVVASPLPEQSRITHLYDQPDLADAYSVRLPPDASDDPEVLARFVLSQQAPWAHQLMRLRDVLVAGFGIKTSQQLVESSDKDVRRIYIFKIYEKSSNEIVLGENDKHLDFRLSVMLQSQPNHPEPVRYLTISTVVHCHNHLGRAYLRLIAPFHRLIVKSYLLRAAGFGWPLQNA